MAHFLNLVCFTSVVVLLCFAFCILRLVGVGRLTWFANAQGNLAGQLQRGIPCI